MVLSVHEAPSGRNQRLGHPPVPYADFGDPQTLNLYGYARNNPLAKADKDGHCIWDLCIVEGIGVVEVVATVVTAYGLYKAGHGFFASMDKAKQDLNDSYRNEEKAVNEATKADTNGNVGKAEDLDKQSEKDYANHAKDVAGAVRDAAQMPGTVTGGDLPASTLDVVSGAVAGIIRGKIVDSAGGSGNSNPNAQQRTATPQPPQAPTPAASCGGGGMDGDCTPVSSGPGQHMSN